MSDSIDADVLNYYELGGEADRLTGNAGGRLEFWRTRMILRGLLGDVPSRVLDVGGGMGVHAAWLAADGHEVTLIDPVPSHVAAAAGIPGVSAAVGDARKLEAGDASADVVLLLGPLYHLTTREERVAAIAEAARVVRPGGLVVAATISRYAALLDVTRRNAFADDVEMAVVEHVDTTGVIDPRRFGSPHFTTAYTHTPDEADGEFADAGLTGAVTVAVEGAPWLVGDLEAIMDDDLARDRMLSWVARLEREPSLLGASSHLLTYARR